MVKGDGKFEDEQQTSSQSVPLGIMDLASFEVLSDHGETIEDDVVVDESSDESTGTMPPLPPASWSKDTRISRCAEMHCRKFRTHGNGNDSPDGEVSFSSILGIGGTSSLTFCSMRALGHRMIRRLYPARRVASQ